MILTLDTFSYLFLDGGKDVELSNGMTAVRLDCRFPIRFDCWMRKEKLQKNASENLILE